MISEINTSSRRRKKIILIPEHPLKKQRDIKPLFDLRRKRKRERKLSM